MSANTNISEGGKGRPFGPVKALMVEGEDGKFYSWYPESEKALGTLSVDKNGVYRASDKGVYGWSQVYVNVATTDHVTGKDPDTGEEVVVRPDPETGEITETVVPVEIRVITPPTKTEYQDGETIDISGMVVKAYGANGDEMQTVPLNQITINPAVAPSASGDTIVSYDASRLEDSYVKNPLTFVKSLKYEVTRGPQPYPVYTVTASSGYFMTVPTGYYFVSDQSAYIQTIGTDETQKTDFVDATAADIDEQIVTMAARGVTSPATSVMSPTYPSLGGTHVLRDMYRLLYMGYGTMANAEITVSWPRPGDGAILETTFDINVGPRSGQGDD